jgi:hypothetical protein
VIISEVNVADVFKRRSQQFHQLVGFRPAVGRCDASRNLLHTRDSFTLVYQKTSDFVQSELFSASRGEGGRPSTSVVGIPSQRPVHIWQVSWVRLAATKTTRGNSTTVIHLAAVICTVVAGFVTLTDSGNLASDPFHYYTHSPCADVQFNLVLSYFSATSSCAILFHACLTHLLYYLVTPVVIFD